MPGTATERGKRGRRVAVRWSLVGGVWLVLASGAWAADFALAPLFTDGAVLQRGTNVPVWGTAPEGAKVTVRFRGQEKSAVAEKGAWRVDLDPLEAGGPFELSASADRTLLVKDVYVGEVWLCAGQSNMQWPVLQTPNSASVIVQSSNPQLRLLTVPREASLAPRTAFQATWRPSSPGSVALFSAIGYGFGKGLHERLRVPVGLVSINAPNSPAEAWIRRETLIANPELKPLAVPRTDTELTPGSLYNGLVHPLVPYAVRGVLWYQGESNVGRAHEYRKLFPALIADWRAAWGREELPFLFVQLAPFRATLEQPAESEWAELRDAQLHAWRTVPKTAMVVTLDAGNHDDIHPRDKSQVAQRLLLAARAVAYGEPIEYAGPQYTGHKPSGGGRLVLSFDHVGQGLEVRGDKLLGFALAGSDRRFHWAEAKIEGDTVVVWCDAVPQPMAVRYAWGDYPEANLWNKDGLPAGPFRSDAFPLLSEAAATSAGASAVP